MLVLIIIALGIMSRAIVHEPNFTPIVSIALFGGIYLNRKVAVALPLLIMILSDILLGWHDTIIFTWGSLALIGCFGLWVRNHKTVLNVVMANLAGSLFFFVVTNWGVWLAGGLYPPTWDGLAQCFVAAIPFYRNTLVSTIVYSAILFGIYEFVALRIKGTRLARVLLTVY